MANNKVTKKLEVMWDLIMAEMGIGLVFKRGLAGSQMQLNGQMVDVEAFYTKTATLADACFRHDRVQCSTLFGALVDSSNGHFDA